MEYKNNDFMYESLKNNLAKLGHRQNLLKNISYLNFALSSLNTGLNIYNGNTGLAALWGVSATCWYFIAKGQSYRQEETKVTIKILDTLKDLEVKSTSNSDQNSLDQKIESQDFPEQKKDKNSSENINELED